MPAGTLARCASAPALRRVLPPYCLVDEHDPRALQPGEAAADFVLSGPAEHGVPGVVHLFGIESPGLTSSLALARMCVEALDGR